MPSTPADLADVVTLARPVVERVVWCTVATVGPDDAPRCRLMHPVWWWDDGVPQALVTARPTPIKVAHLAAHAMVSCFYWDPAHDTVAVDATAEWVPAPDRAAAWDAIAAVDPPVGFDPSLVWPEGPDSDDCGFLRLRATRIVATPAAGPGLRWSGATTS